MERPKLTREQFRQNRAKWWCMYNVDKEEKNFYPNNSYANTTLKECSRIDLFRDFSPAILTWGRKQWLKNTDRARIRL